jgi:hypothetical protein
MPNSTTAAVQVTTLVERSTTLKVVLACTLCVFAGFTAADDEELPDVDFLEYLGSWDESDEDWQVVSKVDEIRREAAKTERNDPVPEGEESTEADDENE